MMIVIILISAESPPCLYGTSQTKLAKQQQPALCQTPSLPGDQYLTALIILILMPLVRFQNRNNYKLLMKVSYFPQSAGDLRVQLSDKRKQ